MAERRPLTSSLLRAHAALASARRRDRLARARGEAAPPGDEHLAESGVREIAETLPERILRVATELFAERGFLATSLREVAAASGCTKPALYYHFRSKEGLFVAALREEAEELTALLDEAIRQEGTVRRRLVESLGALVGHCHLNPHGLALLERAEGMPDEGQPTFDFASIRTMHFDMARRLLAEGVAAGELRGDLPVEDAVLALAGLVHQRTERFFRDGEPIPSDFPERAVDLLWRGIGRETT